MFMTKNSLHLSVVASPKSANCWRSLCVYLPDHRLRWNHFFLGCWKPNQNLENRRFNRVVSGVLLCFFLKVIATPWSPWLLQEILLLLLVPVLLLHKYVILTISISSIITITKLVLLLVLLSLLPLLAPVLLLWLSLLLLILLNYYHYHSYYYHYYFCCSCHKLCSIIISYYHQCF